MSLVFMVYTESLFFMKMDLQKRAPEVRFCVLQKRYKTNVFRPQRVDLGPRKLKNLHWVLRNSIIFENLIFLFLRLCFEGLFCWKMRSPHILRKPMKFHQNDTFWPPSLLKMLKLARTSDMFTPFFEARRGRWLLVQNQQSVKHC